MRTCRTCQIGQLVRMGIGKANVMCEWKIEKPLERQQLSNYPTISAVFSVKSHVLVALTGQWFGLWLTFTLVEQVETLCLCQLFSKWLFCLWQYINCSMFLLLLLTFSPHGFAAVVYVLFSKTHAGNCSLYKWQMKASWVLIDDGSAHRQAIRETQSYSSWRPKFNWL